MESLTKSTAPPLKSDSTAIISPFFWIFSGFSAIFKMLQIQASMNFKEDKNHAFLSISPNSNTKRARLTNFVSKKENIRLRRYLRKILSFLVASAKKKTLFPDATKNRSQKTLITILVFCWNVFMYFSLFFFLMYCKREISLKKYGCHNALKRVDVFIFSNIVSSSTVRILIKIIFAIRHFRAENVFR